MTLYSLRSSLSESHILSLLPHLVLAVMVSNFLLLFLLWFFCLVGFFLTMGNLVAEQFPSFVNVSHSRLLFSTTCVENCHKLWGNHSLTALSIQVAAQCHILFAPSKCRKTTAISS